jgi:CheY-like chemotaxis protein
MHILLIDDSSSTRSLLRTLINSGQQTRHEISEAASGEEALQKVSSGEINLPDLIIMDINMGGMTGYELAREFRQKHSKSDLMPYIIMVTANEGVDVINQALDAGANDYMPKPVNVKILQVRLRVAERMLSQAGTSGSGRITMGLPPATAPTEAPKPAPPPVDDSTNELALQIAAGIEHAEAPIAFVDVAGPEPTFSIGYANSAMCAMTQAERGALEGKSLATIEAWTPEFVTMVSDFIERGSIVSYVPLWSHTRQDVPVHLSFYPIRGEGDEVGSYLVIHHF